VAWFSLFEELEGVVADVGFLFGARQKGQERVPRRMRGAPDQHQSFLGIATLRARLCPCLGDVAGV
jgi:hypothetical protein